MLAALVLLVCGAEPADAGYEDRVVDWGLGVFQRTPDPGPEGKRIEEILVSSEDIVAPSDPWPRVFNAVHVRTRELIVRRELLFAEGQLYSASLAAETERNLRGLIIFSVARVIAVRGRTPD